MQGDNVAATLSKRDKRGHPTSVKSWTQKSVCGSIHADRVSEVQRRLSRGGDNKDIGQYAAALAEVLLKLSDEELKWCTALTEKWNADVPLEDVQRKYDAPNYSVNLSSHFLFAGHPGRFLPRSLNGCTI